MIENKVLISVNVPSLEQKFDIYVPVNRKVSSVIKMIKFTLLELSNGSFDIKNDYAFYNALDGKMYDMNVLIRDTDIRNSSNMVLL